MKKRPILCAAAVLAGAIALAAPVFAANSKDKIIGPPPLEWGSMNNASCYGLQMSGVGIDQIVIPSAPIALTKDDESTKGIPGIGTYISEASRAKQPIEQAANEGKDIGVANSTVGIQVRYDQLSAKTGIGFDKGLSLVPVLVTKHHRPAPDGTDTRGRLSDLLDSGMANASIA